MTFRVIHPPDNGTRLSPYQIVEQADGREVDWVNRFLDHQWVRGLAEPTLRSYAMDLLHFLRWWASQHGTVDVGDGDRTEVTLLDYVRFQSAQRPRPAAASINRRIGVVERALRNDSAGLAGPWYQDFIISIGAARHWALVERVRR